MRKGKAIVRKSTFWNDVRVKNNCTYKDLAKLLDMSPSYCSMICSGEFMPTEGVIKKMCELFDVAIDLGREEFKKSHATWKSTGRTDKVVTISNDEPILSSANKKNLEILETIYGEVEFKVYRKISDRLMRGDKLDLADIYGQVEYADFLKIREILNEGNN